MGIHWPRQEEGSIVWRVELVAKDVDGGNPLYVVLCAQVGGQKAAKLNQGVVALQAQGSKCELGKVTGVEPLPVQAGAGSRRRRLYLVVKVSDEFQVVLSALQEHHTVSLLGHEETQRQRQLVVQQHVLQPLGRLLGVPDLAEVASLFGGVTATSVRCAPGQLVTHILTNTSGVFGRMGTTLRSTDLCFELLSPSHGLQLLRRHLIGDLNAGHFLHHLLEDQQVETDRTGRIFKAETPIFSTRRNSSERGQAGTL